MLQIQFITTNHQHPWRRQLADERFADDGIRFAFGRDNIDRCDYCVVYGNIPVGLSPTLPQHKTIYVTGEPTWYTDSHSKRFLDQFGTVITGNRSMPSSRCLFMPPGIPWQIGAYLGKDDRRRPMTIDTLRTYTPEKRKLVSVICSNKTVSKPHRDRLAFVGILRAHFGDRIDCFGRGVNAFADKEDVLAPYRYHIVLENFSERDYWSEKISDCILALTHPIYYGCRNLEDYLPSDCFTYIDIARPDDAIATIERVINSDKDRQSQDALHRARQLILDEYNIFEVLAKVVKNLESQTSAPEDMRPVTLRCRRDFKQRRHLRKAFYLLKKKYHTFRYNRSP